MTNTNPFHYSIATRVRNPYFLRFLNPQPGDRILDVGCGVGYFTNLFASTGRSDVWGVDADFGSVANAARMPGNKFLAGRAESLPFPDSSFDKVVCSEVLEHLVDDDAAVSEIRRVARPGATVVITVPSPDGVFGARIKRICHSGYDENNWEKHYRDGYTCMELKALLRDGIELNEARYTMVLVTELLMGITKLAYSVSLGKRQLESQAQVMQIRDSWLLRTYRAVFPIFVLLARVEDLCLAPWLKGHMLIAKGEVNK